MDKEGGEERCINHACIRMYCTSAQYNIQCVEVPDGMVGGNKFTDVPLKVSEEGIGVQYSKSQHRSCSSVP